jgi:methylisocitrate lyase
MAPTGTSSNVGATPIHSGNMERAEAGAPTDRRDFVDHQAGLTEERAVAMLRALSVGPSFDVSAIQGSGDPQSENVENTTTMKSTSRFRELLQQPGIIVAPGVHDALTAKLAASVGFEAGYISGSGVSTALLGLPDVGLVTLPEITQMTRYITESVAMPMIVDADTGHGGVLNVMRCVRELERAGAAAVQIEDQEFPKRCGHLDGKTIVPPGDMLGKIRAAIDARIDADFQIIARTDAKGVEGLGGAIERAKLYVEAGADIIFPEALQTEDEFRTMADAIDAPLLANMTEFGKTPYYSAEQFGEWGYKIVIFPVSALRIASRSVLDFFAALRGSGTQQNFVPRMLTRKELYEIIDYEAFEARQQQFAPELV